MTHPQPLSAATLLLAWDLCGQQPPLTRALTLLRLGYPAESGSDLMHMPIVQRDLRLLELRSASFGRTMEARHACSTCNEQIEFELDAADLTQLLAPAATEPDAVLPLQDTTLRLRQATSADLAAALQAKDAQDAQSILFQRCVQTDAGVALDPAAHQAAWQRLEAMHAAAEILLHAACPACGSQERVVLDIAAFLWVEIRRHATLLLDDVHELATAYGWTEADVLALPPRRRQAYLERIGG